MQFKSGYTKANYVKNGNEVFRYVTIAGKEYRQIAIELLDRVGRVIGYKSVTPLKEVN